VYLISQSRFTLLRSAAGLLLASAAFLACHRDVVAPRSVPTTLSILPIGITLDAIAASHTFEAVLQDQNGVVLEGEVIQWSVLSSSVASISPDGTATALANGGTQVVATFGTLEARAGLVVQQRVHNITKLGGDNQLVPPGTQLPGPLRVLVRDRNNHPVAGAVVLFEMSGGGRALTQFATESDESGEASAIWTIPNVPSTSFTVTARVSESPGISASFTASASAAPAPESGFNVELRFLTEVSLSQRAAFTSAANRWESIVTGDLAAFQLNVGAGDCGSGSPAFNELVDDVVIFVTVAEIDGPGKILGQAGPCRVRGGNFLPISGLMTFDSADLASLETNGSLQDVIVHEMGHVLGIGTIWAAKGFLVNPSLPNSPGVDTHFNGVNAIGAFNTIGGASYPGAKVPVESSQGGAGTRDGHWRESVFVNELMTGFLNPGFNPLSIVTIRSLQDLGYAVNPGAADAYALPLGVIAGERGSAVHLFNDIAPVPIRPAGSR
jgi:hypothetical protein